MRAERRNPAGNETEGTGKTYEPPLLVVLGSVAELTREVIDSLTVTTVKSDQVLKEEIEPVGNALWRLRAVRSR